MAWHDMAWHGMTWHGMMGATFTLYRRAVMVLALKVMYNYNSFYEVQKLVRGTSTSNSDYLYHLCNKKIAANNGWMDRWTTNTKTSNKYNCRTSWQHCIYNVDTTHMNKNPIALQRSLTQQSVVSPRGSFCSDFTA